MSKQTGSFQPPHKRRVIAIAGTLLMLLLGTVYSWSFFQNPIVAAMGWSHAETAWAFSIAIFCLGFAAAWGGIRLPATGPKRLAMTGGALYAAGYIIGGIALHNHSLVLFYLGFGIIGGIGMGLGYVTPVATVGRWFPDKKGFATGMVVMGFGFGALIMSKIVAPALMGMTGGNLSSTFICIGMIMLGALVLGAFIKNPPAGDTQREDSAAGSEKSSILRARDCLLSKQWLLMWLVLFVNITAGIMFIGFQSPMLQDLLAEADPGMNTTALAAAGATLIAISSIFNGIGRFFWGGLSDTIGRSQTFRIILGTQVAAFIALRSIDSPVLFSILVCYVLLCYGGGFGTMPSFVLDVFGARLMPVVYGAILTAWSCAGIAGPQLAAIIKDASPGDAGPRTFTICAALLAVGFVFSLFLNNAPFTGKAGRSGP